MTQFRIAGSRDSKDIRELYLHAFPEGENRKVSTLAENLLRERTNPETICLVAEADGRVVGHIAFSPVFIANNKRWVGYILAPLGVAPEYQNRQIGSKLIETGIERSSKLGASVVFVYGDPNYYGRFGFRRDVASGYSAPYQLQYPFGWQALALDEGAHFDSQMKISCVASLDDRELW